MHKQISGCARSAAVLGTGERLALKLARFDSQWYVTDRRCFLPETCGRPTSTPCQYPLLPKGANANPHEHNWGNKQFVDRWLHFLSNEEDTRHLHRKDNGGGYKSGLVMHRLGRSARERGCVLRTSVARTEYCTDAPADRKAARTGSINCFGFAFYFRRHVLEGKTSCPSWTSADQHLQDDTK